MISNLEILTIHAEKSVFNRNADYSESEEHSHNLEFNVGMAVDAKDAFHGIVKLGCNVNQGIQSEVPYTMEVVIVGEFQTSETPFEEYAINAISLLFPYLRTHISTVTTISGVDSLIIPAINIYDWLQENESSQTSENNAE